MPEPQNPILDNLNTAVLLLDARNRVVTMNAAAEALFGTSRRMAGHLAPAELPVNGGQHKLEDYLAAARERGSPYSFRELALAVAPERETRIDLTLTPLLEEGSGRLLVEVSPVDRIRRIAREEQLMAQHLTAREIARGLAHEINNPLGGLRGAAQLLERELPEDAREYTQVIIREADRLQALINRMLGPRSAPEKTEVNIHEVIDHVTTLIRAEAGEGLRFVPDFDPSIPALAADRDQLVQAVLNIVRNAWQAGGNGAEITLRTRTVSSYTIGRTMHRLVLRLDIVDNGPGIPPELLEQIFYPMVTGRSEGTGLGLTIAQSLVNLHGGLIECDSRPGRTCFTILLPLATGTEKSHESS